MSNYYHAILTLKDPPPLATWEAAGSPVAEVVFQAEDPHANFQSVLDGLSALEVIKDVPGATFQPRDIVRLADLPHGKTVDRPDWSNTRVKLWVIQPVCRPVV